MFELDEDSVKDDLIGFYKQKLKQKITKKCKNDREINPL